MEATQATKAAQAAQAGRATQANQTAQATRDSPGSREPEKYSIWTTPYWRWRIVEAQP